MTIPNGFYTIRNVATGAFLGVEGSSTATGAALVTGVDTGGNDQVFAVSTDGGYTTLLPSHTADSGYVAGLGREQTFSDGRGGFFVVSGNYQSPDQADASRWVIVDGDGSLLVNGVSYPAYFVRSANEDGQLLYLADQALHDTHGCVACEAFFDATSSTTTTPHQQWAFVPAVPHDPNLPVPYLGSASPEQPGA